MKKIFAIILTMCIIITALSFSVLAVDTSEIKIDNSIATVYAGTTVTDSEAEKGTRANPFSNFEDAYNAATSSVYSGEKRKIVLLGDVPAYSDNTTAIVADAVYLYLNNFDYVNKAGTVYVCGEYDANSEKYTGSVNFYKNALGCVLTLGANMVFYNMTFKNISETSTANIWVAAALHDLTFGFNISKDCKSMALVGSCFNTAGASHCDDALDGSEISFFDGTFGDVFLAHRSANTNYTISENDNIICNFYGGSFSRVCVTSTNSGSKVGGSVNINIYNAKVSKDIINPSSGGVEESMVTFYNGCKDSIVAGMSSGLGGTFKNGVNVFEVAGETPLPAPSYAVNLCGVQDKTDGNEFSIRFVGTVDSLEFDYVGFMIDANGTDYSKTASKVYTSILGAESTIYTAEQLGSNYIYTRSITGIPTTGTITFTVKPFIRIGNVVSGVNYYGQEYTVTYIDGVLVR